MSKDVKFYVSVVYTAGPVFPPYLLVSTNTRRTPLWGQISFEFRIRLGQIAQPLSAISSRTQGFHSRLTRNR